METSRLCDDPLRDCTVWRGKNLNVPNHRTWLWHLGVHVMRHYRVWLHCLCNSLQVVIGCSQIGPLISSSADWTSPAPFISLHRPCAPGPDHLDSLCWPLSRFPTSIFAWEKRRGPKTLHGSPAMVSPMLNRRWQNFPQCPGHTPQIWLRFAWFAVFL